MKYTDEQIDGFLKCIDIELLPPQREFFKRVVNREGPVYVCFARQQGRSYLTELLRKFEKEMEG